MFRKQGLIYDYKWGRLEGEVVFCVRAIVITELVLPLIQPASRHIGSALIVVGLAGFIFTFAPVATSEISYRWNSFVGTGLRQEKADEALIERARAEEQEKEQTQILAQELGVPNSYFSIYIPKINAKAQVVENVDPYDSKAYLKALSQGVAHAAGSVFPGMPGGTYLFAHSSAPAWQSAKYNTVFYLLKQLNPKTQTYEGDDIYVFFLDKLHKYKVVEKQIVGPNDVSWLKDVKQGPERLILQTCWPPGTSLKRLIVVAEPVK